MFLDREDEINIIDKIYQSEGASLVVLYGRRRIGKTELCYHLIRKYSGLYFLFYSSNLNRLLDNFAETMYHAGTLPVKPSIKNFREFFVLLSEISQSRKILVVIDEFQRGTDLDKDLNIELQALWDQTLSKSQIKLILTGSAVGVIESNLLSHSSPLYGRRTAQLKMKPLSFKSAVPFFKDMDAEDMVRAFSVYGGTPMYLLNYDPKLTLQRNIKTSILNKMSLLFQEPLFILSENTREPMRYLDILENMASGASTLSEIGNKAGINQTEIPKYMYYLTEGLDIVERHYPIFEYGKRGRTRYRIADNFFRFWFKFIRDKVPMIEFGLSDEVSDVIMRGLDEYVSKIFEDICIEHIATMVRTKSISATDIGRWWFRETEIDAVAVDSRSQTVYFSESKWTNKKVGRDTLNELIKKSELFPWYKERRNDKYIIYSRSGFSFSDDEALLIDLKKIVNDLIRDKAPSF